jgi:FSR family fosmidomycin resistance protein-like MFS transporter
MMQPEKNANIKVIFGLTLIHFTGDFYSSFVNPLLPVFVERFFLTLTQVGLITGISRFLSFIVQPSVGYLADRSRTRLFVLGGPFLAIVFISLVGVPAAFHMFRIYRFIYVSSLSGRHGIYILRAAFRVFHVNF